MVTLEETRWTMVSRKQFAEWCVAASNRREASWDGHGYNMPVFHAVTVTVPIEWRAVVSCLLTAGYADIWDWCQEQGVELGQSGSDPQA